MKKLTIVTGCLFFVLMSASVVVAAYVDTIPPEILRRYEPSIVKNDRPVLVKITQAMIFGLRDKGDQGGDVYSFDLDPEKISSVQLEILRNWVREGHNILFWGVYAARKYAVLFSDAVEYNWLIYGEQSSLSKHPVNTDIKDVYFYTEETNGRRSFNLLSRYPPDTEIIVSCKSGVIAGRAPYGRGNIYFALHYNKWGSGRDKDRWALNFHQWMLGFRVPGAADTSLGTGSHPEGTVAKTQDCILLKNGDTVSGRLLVEKMSVKTSYADLSFDVKQIETIVFDGAGQNIEMLVLRTGDKLSGVVGPNKIKVKLTGGQEMQIEKAKIKKIDIQQ